MDPLICPFFRRFRLLPFAIGDDYHHRMSETELLRAFWNERSEEAYAELVRRYAGPLALEAPVTVVLAKRQDTCNNDDPT
jgi:hypothetical protein